MTEIKRVDYSSGRFTLIFLAAPDDSAEKKNIDSPLIELTYNWDSEELGSGRNFGHLAFRVDDIYETCQKIIASGVVINRPPRDGRMAFIKSPDNISIELLQEGDALPEKEPWASMPNKGSW
jgi:lactoylglutathione lyase